MRGEERGVAERVGRSAAVGAAPGVGLEEELLGGLAEVVDLGQDGGLHGGVGDGVDVYAALVGVVVEHVHRVLRRLRVN